MNKKMVFYLLGKIIHLEAVLMILPTICALIYGEFRTVNAFITTILLCVLIGLVLMAFCRGCNKIIFAKEGFVIVALSWISLSALGALPFVISGEIPSYFDAFFEIVSGFTTTGASILTDVEAMSHGLLFWRSFTHWVGGMGVLVLVMAMLPSESGRTIHIMRAEMPGPIVGKLVPKVKSTAKILYLIYIAITALQVILLYLGDMNLFQSLIYSFGTAGTGGFSINADGLAGYSAYSQWVITIFMLIFGVNFNLYYLILVRKIKTALKSDELWTYALIVVGSVLLVAFNIYNTFNGMYNVSDTIRHCAFQVASIITTTGYSIVDFNLWPGLSKMILLILMLIGGCAGSTAGGIKVSRVVILYKHIKANLKQVLHSRSVNSVSFEGKPLDKTTVDSVTSYLTVYFFCLIATVLLISFDNFPAISGVSAPFSAIETHISAAISCFNNVGPGFAAVGPLSNFADYSAFSKIVLSCAMLLGRLEIYPMLLLFSSNVWTKKRAK